MRTHHLQILNLSLVNIDVSEYGCAWIRWSVQHMCVCVVYNLIFDLFFDDFYSIDLTMSRQLLNLIGHFMDCVPVSIEGAESCVCIIYILVCINWCSNILIKIFPRLILIGIRWWP